MADGSLEQTTGTAEQERVAKEASQEEQRALRAAQERRWLAEEEHGPLGNAEDPDMAVMPVKREKTRVTKTGVKPERVFHTHDVHGGGSPRLVPVFDDGIDIASGAKSAGRIEEFPLEVEVTSIGSESSCDICLPDLLPVQAEIRRDDVDEYVFFNVSASPENTVDGRQVDTRVLRTGNRVEMGPWTFTYAREESADHGSPFGGHEGGEFAGYRAPQRVPRPRGTSPNGGKEPTIDDPGEYY